MLIAKGDKNIQVSDSASLAAYRIGTQRNSGTALFLQKQGIPFTENDENDQVLRQLMADEIDLWAFLDPVYRYFAQDQGVKGLKVVKLLARQKEYLALNKDTPDEVVQRLQKALDGLRKDGSLRKIAESHHEPEVVADD